MDWFGITKYGVSDPIKDFLRPDYKEPIKMENIMERLEKYPPGTSLSDIATDFDITLGTCDGFSYGSLERMNKMRDKGFMKPVGPIEMYRKPATGQMDHGFFLGDSSLKGQNWFKTPRYSRINSEMTNYLNECLKANKYYKM